MAGDYDAENWKCKARAPAAAAYFVVAKPLASHSHSGVHLLIRGRLAFASWATGPVTQATLKVAAEASRFLTTPAVEGGHT